jgi:hypothetical protein
MSRVPKVKWHRCIWKKGGLCWFCGGVAETVDHAKPRSRGGSNRDDNLYPACFRCNNLKSDCTVAEFRRIVRLLVCRSLLSKGIIVRCWEKFPIKFYGEGNAHPFLF